jgi:hypothetical protein
VLRDPVASLVHEIAHAVDDCEGRNPAERELEAVRIENVYRRAAGLCQRSAYGDDTLGAETVKLCGALPASVPARRPASAAQQVPPAAAERRAADSGPTPDVMAPPQD